MSGKPIIAIDAGHNSYPDIGTSYNQYSEDKIVLDVARELTYICQENGIRSFYCAPKSASSVLDSLQQRIAIANKSGATLYVSIHCNAATPTDGSRGCETYAISTAGKTIGTNINRELGKLGFKIRGVKETLDGGAAPYVVRMTNAIAVLVEICFLDATEDTNVFDKVGIKAIAQAIYNGLTHGSQSDTQPGNHDNDPVPPTNPPERSILVDAAKWYKALPHQDAAWKALEKDLTGLQLIDFRSGYTPQTAQPVSTPVVQLQQKKMTVAEWIATSDGSTSGVKGLSDQIINAMGSVGLVKFEHVGFTPSSTCDPYFHPEFAQKLKNLLDSNASLVIRCNSAYRSPVRQLVLRTFFERGLHDITAAARVGTGNHERGLAIDAENWVVLKPKLISSGFKWQGQGDPMHFELDIDSMAPHYAIKAFQQLANKYAQAGLAEDGIWGDKTKQAMLNAPASGW